MLCAWIFDCAGVHGNSVLCSQFFCEPETALKMKSIKNKV